MQRSGWLVVDVVIDVVDTSEKDAFFTVGVLKGIPNIIMNNIY